MGAIQRLEQRVINIERMVASMFKQLRRENQNAGYDIEAGRVNTAKAQAGVDVNTLSIVELTEYQTETLYELSLLQLGITEITE